MPVQKNCTVCGKEFTAENARAETAKTCSRACRGVLTAKAYEAQRVQRECQMCGDPLSVSAGRAERGNGLYCSRACKDRALIGRSFRAQAEDGETVDSAEGYVYEYAKDHPLASRGRVFQHRLVMEKLMRISAPDHQFLVEIGGVRYLKPGIDVHHRNDAKQDNRPVNLLACTKAAHKAMHGGSEVLAGEVWPEPGDDLVIGDRMLVRACVRCGAQFNLKRSAAARAAGKFCSLVCFRADQASSGLPAQVPMTCQTCGAGFLARRSKVLAGQGRYCSNPCRIKFLATTHHTKDQPP